ncbi:MAG: formylmethanofuran dehydrogenase subunit E family protein [Candidatus Bathyarchaeia archaeon]|jgi:formylmethanofuran dehydrogenase subunit E
MPKPNELTTIIEFARKLHGHVGPFLVIGLKMGAAAKKALNLSDTECTLLTAEVAVPLHPPFSCLLDGIQVSTTCTIGNQRLQVKNSKTIQATFTRQKGAKKVKITLTQNLSEQLEQKQKQNQLTEELALEIADMPENQLFNITLE